MKNVIKIKGIITTKIYIFTISQDKNKSIIRKQDNHKPCTIPKHRINTEDNILIAQKAMPIPTYYEEEIDLNI